MCAASGPAAQTEVRGQVVVELRAFRADAGENARDRTNTSMYGQLELLQDFDGGTHRLELIPFAHVDQRDSQRTHADLREASYKLLERDFELTVGISRVFWGVAESKHLVNVINQVDLVENLDRERFLGQPRLRGALLSELGTFEPFVLTGFRERTLPGPRGRPRLPLSPSDTAEYQSEIGRYRPDLSGRYSHSFGRLDHHRLPVAQLQRLATIPRARQRGRRRCRVGLGPDDDVPAGCDGRRAARHAASRGPRGSVGRGCRRPGCNVTQATR